jgi:hypothetical protein
VFGVVGNVMTRQELACELLLPCQPRVPTFSEHILQQACAADASGDECHLLSELRMLSSLLQCVGSYICSYVAQSVIVHVFACVPLVPCPPLGRHATKVCDFAHARAFGTLTEALLLNEDLSI